ncbi:MAG: hypothetical protein ACNFW9_02805 [Candidatus Kerfeldbacteria bacterium]
MINQKAFTYLMVVILITIMAVGLSVLAWYWYENKESTNINGVNPDFNANDLSKWPIHENEVFGFRINYPSTFKKTNLADSRFSYHIYGSSSTDNPGNIYLEISHDTYNNTKKRIEDSIEGDGWKMKESSPGVGGEAGHRLLITEGDGTEKAYFMVQKNNLIYNLWTEKVDDFSNIEIMMLSFDFFDPESIVSNANINLNTQNTNTNAEQVIPILTIDSDKLLECFSPTMLINDESLNNLLNSIGFTDRNFSDLCLATNSNPQKRFFVIVPTDSYQAGIDGERKECVDCFQLQVNSLVDGSNLIINQNYNKPYDVIIESGVKKCEFGVRDGEYLTINCEVDEKNDKYRYFDTRTFRYSGDRYFYTGFKEQCSIWDTDVDKPLQTGESEKFITFYNEYLKVRCGNTALPPNVDWSIYSQDGFTFRYPDNFYFYYDDEDGGIMNFYVHPRHLGGFEGGSGPFNSSYIKLKPVVEYQDLIDQLNENYDFVGEWSDTLTETTDDNGNKKIIVEPGPGLCSGEYVYIFSDKYLLEYGQYCMNWNGIDETFNLK